MLVLNKVFTTYLLLFSWNVVKFKQNLSSSTRIILYPINKSWINKTSYLIRKGSFVYKPLLNKTNNGFNFQRFRFKIIENSFLLLFKPLFYKNLRKNSFLSSSNLALNIILTWNKDIKYFLKGIILRSCLKVNKNRLKNIFSKFIKDKRFWEEVDKMFLVGLIDISSSLIFKNCNFLESGLLSSFFLNLYLSELDLYIYNLSITYNCRINVISFKQTFLKYSKKLSFSFSYASPIKFQRFFVNFISLKEIYLFNFKKFINLSFLFLTMNFKRTFFYVRYLHYFLFAVIGSKSFSIYLKDKVISFLRSNLKLELSELLLITTFKRSIFFLGVYLKFFSLSFHSSNKLLNKVNSKLNNYKIKLSKLYINRAKSELLLNLSFLTNKGFKSSFTNDRNFWMTIFQLESVRCTQFGKLMLSKNNSNLFSYDLFSSIKYKDNYNIGNYSFNFYLKRLSFTFKDIITNFSAFITSSVLPLELSLSFLVDDFKKSLMFLFTDFTNAKLSNFSIKLCQDLRKDVSTVYNKKALTFITINIPFMYLFEKLRLLGFIHPFKKRPIGNVKYILFSDIYIIKSFGLLANSFILWFKLCSNFSKVKFIVELLRQSCFLTLSRKHNKSKIWVYHIYTRDLILTRNLSTSMSYFPSRKFLEDIISNTSFFNDLYVFHDEYFFLTF